MNTRLLLTIALLTSSITGLVEARSHRRAAPQSTEAAPILPGPPPNDTARFLAGMPLPPSSPLAALTKDPAWQEHSGFFEKAFAKLNVRQFAKLRNWQTANLPES